ncbi:hypothetical protein GCM10023340_43890 [Nocardioides marinquilinus]|uniref:eCIS core domain-containing protein n=1 Tax=Nocardioides marinquilinus TaxID=1210400 RepID=A0ABP9Q431_9ACTN
MELTHEHEHAPTPVPVKAPEIEPPAPAAPVPMAMGTVMVGHAEDRAETDADARADVALRRLAAKEAGTGSGAGGDGEAHQHGPGCDHVRRAPAPVPSGAPVVGYEGGALDGDTSAAISSRVGRGRPLEGPVLRRMETAFGTGLGNVRIHDDATAAKLNHQVSARAFTTGKDIFFGSGQYAPETPDGERVLAHELAHTLQPPVSVTRMLQDGGVRRLVGEPPATGDVSAPAAPRLLGRGGAGTLAAGETGETGDADGAEGGTDGPGLTTVTVPSTVAAVAELSDDDVLALASDTRPSGPLQGLLTGPFAGSWAQATGCLADGAWPGAAQQRFGADAAAALLRALRTWRDGVLTAVAAEAGPMLLSRLQRERAKLGPINGSPAARALDLDIDRVELGSGPGRFDLLATFGAPEGDAAGGESIVTVVGRYPEWGAELFTEALGRVTGGSLQPAALALAVRPRLPAVEAEPIVVEKEDIPTELREADAATLELVRVAKFVSETVWGRMTEEATAHLTDEAAKQEELDKHEYAWNQALEFKSRLGKAWVALDRAEGAESAGGGIDADPAARQAYDAQLAEVWRLRDELVQLQIADPVDPEAAEVKVAELRAAVAAAAELAETVYGGDEDDEDDAPAAPGPAELRAVFGPRAARAGSDAKAALEALNDAFGLALRTEMPEKEEDEEEDEYGEYDDDLEADELDGEVVAYGQGFWDDDKPEHLRGLPEPEAAAPVSPAAEAFTMAPHVDTMLDALPTLVAGGALSLTDGKNLAKGEEVGVLEDLVQDHTAVAGGSDTSPQAAADAPVEPPPGGPFDDYDADRLADVQDAAVGLWSTVGAVADQDGGDDGPEAPSAIADLKQAAGALSGRGPRRPKKP